MWIGLLLVTFLVAGCSGIEPYEPRDNREEGPEKGVFTGSEGEFVILKKTDQPDTESKTSEKSDETAKSKEKKKKIDNSEQQP
jgi:hypothetical protein